MQINIISKLITPVLLIVFLTSCSPSNVEVSIYTTDIDVAQEGEVLEVPVMASFSLYSDDDGELESASQIAEKYLAPDSIFSQSSGDWGETLVIETTIPMGTLDSLQNYLASNNRVAVLLVQGVDEIEISLSSTDYADALNSELTDINFMLGFELPGDSTNFRVISDSRNEVQVDATAVFVSEKPYLYYSKVLKRRDEAEIVFKGTTDSVYSEINPLIYINYP
ncbi:hypothetical protein [Candidatus Pseudothioglobus singularis]|uniref:Uncharacterized protein n=1 Tax=Candidatus Pseudothioglobus singularis PS1 TaxID=1125411 RepID=A0A0M3T2F9_9GAMM|nr:hypothetical protein [Candidatus Pseudothioglobus singularis]ALE02665.1 hypothetical protein W908_03380 [Candidatus Pseudothioglobus singularis PS1]